MKLVLIKDVPSLGKVGDVKDVADGYARNFLLPRGMAVEASAGQLKQMAQRREVDRLREAKQRQSLEAQAEQLRKASVTFSVKVGDGGRLYGSITSKDIGDALEAQAHLNVDRRHVELEEPIRTLGSHKVPVHLSADLRPEVTVIVQEE